jgi:hypothetical protein
MKGLKIYLNCFAAKILMNKIWTNNNCQQVSIQTFQRIMNKTKIFNKNQQNSI